MSGEVGEAAVGLFFIGVEVDCQEGWVMGSVGGWGSVGGVRGVKYPI
jgi:hypothetical protein